MQGSIDLKIIDICLKEILKLNLSVAELIYFIDYLKNSNINIKQSVKYSNKELKTIEELPNIDFILSPYYFKGVNISLKEQGKLLAEYVKTKDSKIRDKLILSYLMYTYKATYNLSLKLNKKFEDIMTYGYEGLIMAIDNYDVKKGNNINIYLPKAIRNSIYKNIASDEDLQVDWTTAYYVIKYKGYIESLFGISVENNMFMIEMLTELVSKSTDKIKVNPKQYIENIITILVEVFAKI